MADSAAIRHLFSADGEAALAAVMRARPLLAFDFDGTLAPIVQRPGRARVPAAVAERLARLAARRPVAVVTGRAIADVRARLGFEPRHIIGNHGAEDSRHAAVSAGWAAALDPLRRLLAAHAVALAEAGVVVEDKRQSIALHYRLAGEPARASALALQVLGLSPQPLSVVPGKMVVNVAAQGAPDKAHAVRTLVARTGARCALFVGDDANDEPVFAAAPADWLTVRVGPEIAGSSARFYLDDSGEIAALLDRLLASVPARAAASPGWPPRRPRSPHRPP